MRIDVRVDIEGAIRKLGAAPKQAEWAAVVAINRILSTAQRELIADMARTFKSPTAYTLGGTFVRQAKRGKLQGRVALKDERSAGKGTPATKYLRPTVYGGDRGMKRFERALYLAGILPNGMYAVPGSGARMDAHGNMERGQIVQILSWFQAFPDVGSRKNSTEASRARIRRGGTKKLPQGRSYFVLRSPRGKLPPGVYEYMTNFGYIRPLLIFIDGAPNYERRFDFFGVVRATHEREFRAEYARALREALATAK